MRIDVKKLYYGRAEIRDYDVRSCINKDEPVEIFYNANKMTLSPADLVKKEVTRSKVMKSKMANGKDYRLVGYDWNPDEMDY